MTQHAMKDLLDAESLFGKLESAIPGYQILPRVVSEIR